MRDLNMEEIGHVYGATGTAPSPCYPSENKGKNSNQAKNSNHGKNSNYAKNSNHGKNSKYYS